MKQITLCLAFHNHQPVGNFPWVFEDAYRAAYLPMIESLERHPQVRVSLHYTGPLFDWIAANRPEFLDRLAGLVQRGQVEMMTGGYYEPILPAIPEADRLGQIRKMTDFVAGRLGARPTGMWLAERVWEPQLASTLNQADVKWTIVDDTHFKMTGLTDDDLFGYYVTEDQGRTLSVFATSKRLRYVIPWSPVEDVIGEIRSWATDDGELVAVMGDDGEKFGVWPGTYDHCWTHGWIDRFFQAITDNSSWLNIAPLGEIAASKPARGRIYLPTASYAEMLEWALPANAAVTYSRVVHEAEAAHRDDLLRFLRGGYWRNFLVKYEETNTMHKKMLRAHAKAYLTRGEGPNPDSAALDELWMAQCNCPYWHGVFGGVYMTDIRSTTFRHLIRSEQRSDQLLHGGEPWITAEQIDFDRDSRDELIVDTTSASYYVDLSHGGSLFEWDVRSASHNLVSVMTRREEAYHATLRAAARDNGHTDDTGGAKTIHDVVRVKEGGLEKMLHFDWYRRACLIDHFLGDGTTPTQFADCTYVECGDFVLGSYDASVGEGQSRRVVTLSRDGRVAVAGFAARVNVEKTLRIDAADSGFTAAYKIENRSDRSIPVNFGVEFSLNVLGGGGNPSAFRRLGQDGRDGRFDVAAVRENVKIVSYGNEYLGIDGEISIDRPASAWWSSIDSISSSEGGFERVHQGSALLLSWPIHLEPGVAWSVQIRADAKGS
jgi:alpha-amylase